MVRKILIAEDDADMRQLYRKVLQFSGYDVVAAVDGRDALEKFTAHRSDIVIADMNMPRMSGLELIKALRRQDADVYIILITAYGTSDTEKRAFSVGANEYIPKPFDLNELRERVQDYFDNL